MGSDITFLKLIDSSNVAISNLKIRPMTTEYAPTSYVEPIKNLEIWCKKNSNYTDDFIKDKTRNNLINYNNEININIIK